MYRDITYSLTNSAVHIVLSKAFVVLPPSRFVEIIIFQVNVPGLDIVLTNEYLQYF